MNAPIVVLFTRKVIKKQIQLKLYGQASGQLDPGWTSGIILSGYPLRLSKKIYI